MGPAKIGHKTRFVLKVLSFEFQTGHNKSYFLTNFSTGYRENNPRFGFLDKFYVDGYLTEIFAKCVFSISGVFFVEKTIFCVTKHGFLTKTTQKLKKSMC